MMLRVLKSFYVLEHFQEDHLIILVEMMDKNQNPKFELKNLIFEKKNSIQLL
jgi:hypothetical protein